MAATKSLVLGPPANWSSKSSTTRASAAALARAVEIARCNLRNSEAGADGAEEEMEEEFEEEDGVEKERGVMTRRGPRGGGSAVLRRFSTDRSRLRAENGEGAAAGEEKSTMAEVEELAVSRAYDRAAIKFRGVDADINFNLSDYDDNLKQMRNLTKEEFVHILRRQSTGFARGSSKYRG
uniref:AP2/ERF domain-containing protein n=1 Tax=Ananas comosus var. bracteatus TaxID=296719 RepID=A0A6V7Q968_ANACO|nr:unnamed protein product [Ananas comosus var. bracteatus]